MFRQLTTTAAATLLVTSLAASAQARDLDTNRALHEEAALLTARIEDISSQIQAHTDQLADLARNVSLARETHAARLEAARAAVRRDLRPAVQRLEEIQYALPAWKQKGVERLRESADRLSAHLAAATATKWADPRLPPGMNDAYQAHLSAAAHHVEALIATSDAASGYLHGRLKAADAHLIPLLQ